MKRINYYKSKKYIKDIKQNTISLDEAISKLSKKEQFEIENEKGFYKIKMLLKRRMSARSKEMNRPLTEDETKQR